MQTAPLQQTQAQIRVNAFIRSVYNWMAIGLALTGGIAYLVSTNLNILMTVQKMFWPLAILTIGMVWFLSARVHKLQATTATALFLAYAALNGLTLSWIFIAYTSNSIATTFFICSATFAASSVYGMVTKKDLTGMGQFMMMGLIGIIIATLVNLFLRSSGLQMIISYVGVIIFVGLTAYDTQKIKHMAMSQPADLESGTVRKGAIMGALSLYLDFLNMFIMLLHIFGGRD
ncbi:MAG: Bax inhibitor-1/YccA family protein [Desulfobacterales bacterium]|nr:Bax inhibitor-1/YccA family protein [Desulfobacterales bacterium]MCP4163777.1 Bax inhibitor-1/YccA family protein [Deltaproteobacteria bacterium]